MSQTKVKHLVVDSGAFILNFPIQDHGDEIYTLPNVVNEIKDEKTRESLNVLTYDLKFREPTEEDVKFVSYFAKKTGDFSQLSITDIRLIALTVRLEKEINKGINLKESPEIKIFPTNSHSDSKSNQLNIKDLELFGYDLKNYQQIKQENGRNKENENHDCVKNIENKKNLSESDTIEQSSTDSEESDVHGDNKSENKLVIDCEDGWITQDNYQEIRHKLLGINFEDQDDEELTVACVTGDFAMQNVLMQMGLNVLSPKDGLHIRQKRQYVLRCYACCRINPPTATDFCKHCGNHRTLKRVSVTINQDGTVKMHINFKRPIVIRGTRFSLPKPQGGKHANNLIYCEDQQMPQQRKSKLAVQEKKHLDIETILNDPDYLTRSNPFAINDVYSRASRMLTKPKKMINPNETRKPTGNKKKNKRV